MSSVSGKLEREFHLPETFELFVLMAHPILKLAFLLCILSVFCDGYKPVVMYHGINGSYRDFDQLQGFIKKYHPGTQTVSLNLYNGEASIFTNMNNQVTGVIAAIKKLNFPSFHLVCHSQGFFQFYLK